MGSDSIPPPPPLLPPKNTSFRWEYKPRSSLCTHEFHCTDSKDSNIHVLNGWMPATKTHPACTIHKDGMWLPQWLNNKTVTSAKISPKVGNPRDVAGVRRRKKLFSHTHTHNYTHTHAYNYMHTHTNKYTHTNIHTEVICVIWTETIYFMNTTKPFHSTCQSSVLLNGQSQFAPMQELLTECCQRQTIWTGPMPQRMTVNKKYKYLKITVESNSYIVQ